MSRRLRFFLNEGAAFMKKAWRLANTNKATNIERALRRERNSAKRRSETKKEKAKIWPFGPLEEERTTTRAMTAVSATFSASSFEPAQESDRHGGDVHGSTFAVFLFFATLAMLCASFRRHRRLPAARYCVLENMRLSGE